MSNEVKRFEMQAPHGTRIFPSMLGCIIEYNDELKEEVEKWLEDERVRFGQVSTEDSDLVACPKCNGELLMRDGVPLYCTLCHGRGKVTSATAASYTKSLSQKPTTVRKQQIVEETQTVRPGKVVGTPPPRSPHDQLRAVIAHQTNQVAVPLKQLPPVEEMEPGQSYSATTVVDDDDDFVAPVPGDEDFIGPIQE